MPRDLKPHGTNAAWARHYRRREDPCQLCATARNAYKRWQRAGFPPEGPPPPYADAVARREDFAWLRRADVDVPEAARRLRISLQSARRYEAARVRPDQVQREVA